MVRIWPENRGIGSEGRCAESPITSALWLLVVKRNNAVDTDDVLQKSISEVPKDYKDWSKGSRNTHFSEFAPRFGTDWVDLREQNRRRSKAYAEDCASEDRPKMA